MRDVQYALPRHDSSSVPLDALEPANNCPGSKLSPIRPILLAKDCKPRLMRRKIPAIHRGILIHHVLNGGTLLCCSLIPL